MEGWHQTLQPKLGKLKPGQSRATKLQILRILDQGNRFSQRLAAHIRQGHVRLHFRRLAFGYEALYNPRNKIIYVNSRMTFQRSKGLYRAAVSVIHEGQHYFDEIAGAIRWSNDPLLEARAFLREAQFARDIGRPGYSVFGRIRARSGSTVAWNWVRRLYGFP